MELGGGGGGNVFVCHGSDPLEPAPLPDLFGSVEEAEVSLDGAEFSFSGGRSPGLSAANGSRIAGTARSLRWTVRPR